MVYEMDLENLYNQIEGLYNNLIIKGYVEYKNLKMLDYEYYICCAILKELNIRKNCPEIKFAEKLYLDGKTKEAGKTLTNFIESLDKKIENQRPN